MHDATVVDGPVARVNGAELRLAGDTYVRCQDCGARAATDELLRRHHLRRCPGPIKAPLREAA